MEGIKFSFAAMKELRKSVLYQTLEKCKSVFWFVFWFSSAINILVLFLPLYTSQVLDRVLSSGSSSTLMMLSVVTLAALICSALLDVCRSLTMAKVADWIDREATPDLILKAISLTSIKGSTSSGEVIRDLGMVKGFITGMGIFSLFDMPWAVVYLVAIFMIHKTTGCIAVVGIVLLVLMAIWNEMATKRIVQESTEENVHNIGYIDTASRNAEVLEAMGMIRHIVSEWSSRNDTNRALQMKAQSRSNMILGMTKFIRSVLQIAVIGVGAWLAINGHKTAGGIIASSILMGRALAPFEAAINTWKMLLSARISYKRLQTLLLSAPQRDQSMALPAPKGVVSLERVFFTPYGSNKPTIKGVSFSVGPGTVTGIIGASASGKSTLVKLIVGVWKPISGVVRLDGADVYTWNREDFGKHVGYLPQDVELFNASIKTNIARMMPNPNAEDVVKAATIAGIHEMILQLPNGYDTVIGSHGIVLSGGQKQMVGLARAFFGDVKMLVLDEPNANMDGKAESNLIKAIMYARSKGITVFIVTHKVQLLSVVDQVIVMDDGMISTMGSRNEILDKLSGKQATGGTAKPTSANSQNTQGGAVSESVQKLPDPRGVPVQSGATVNEQNTQGGAVSESVQKLPDPRGVPVQSGATVNEQNTQGGAVSESVQKLPDSRGVPVQSGATVNEQNTQGGAVSESVQKLPDPRGVSVQSGATVNEQNTQGGAVSESVQKLPDPRGVPVQSGIGSSTFVQVDIDSSKPLCGTENGDTEVSGESLCQQNSEGDLEEKRVRRTRVRRSRILPGSSDNSEDLISGGSMDNAGYEDVGNKTAAAKARTRSSTAIKVSMGEKKRVSSRKSPPKFEE